MRQWGSSLNHNGMSFFRATIPANAQLYHGTHTSEALTGIEWLAFEIEHAEVFARSRGPGGRRPPGGGPGERPGRPPGEDDRNRPPPPPMGYGGEPDLIAPYHDGPSVYAETHGYVHEYRATRTLDKLLYVDGMSAGKTSMGTLDTQDYLLRNDTTSSAPWGDYERAQSICALGAEWGIEGVVRMEAGFELIFCNFTDGMELVSATQRPAYDKPESYNDLGQFEYMRGIAQRYDGITAGRVEIDYSSMVSAFFYPINLTNPDPSKSNLPRLASAEPIELEQIRSDLQHVLSQSMSEEHVSVDWQGVVDMIVTRYSDRLQFMASNSTSQKSVLSEINFLLSIFVDYSSSTPNIPEAVKKCSSHYLKPVTPQSDSDYLIQAAVSTVSHKICSTLFEVRDMLLADESAEWNTLEHAKSLVGELISFLNWSTWLECGKCAYDEVCFVAIWPWGRVEDHEQPGCVKNDDVFDRRGYWDFGR
jgi:hypothetical protein